MQNQQAKMADRSTRKRKYRAARKDKMLVLRSVAQACPTLCDPTDWSLPGSSVHGILQEQFTKKTQQLMIYMHITLLLFSH